MAYTKYSLTPANNTAAPPDGAPEGMLPSAVNDTMRDMMAQIRDVGDGVRDGTYTMTAPKITGGTITGVTLTGNTLTNPVITGATLTTSVFNGTVGATTASTGAFTTLSTSSTTTLSGLTASTALALDASKNVVSVTNTGTGNNVLSASPTLTGTIAGASLSLSSLTSGRVTYAGASGLLSDSANLVWNNSSVFLGIGETSPTCRLSIKGNNAPARGQITIDSTDTAQYSFYNGATEYFSQYTDVSGSNSGTTYANYTAAPFAWRINGAETMRIASGGNVGIGTSSPSCLLEVNQAATSFPGFKISGSSSPGMQIVDASGVTAHFANDSAGTYFGTTTSNPLIFRTVNTERMRIDSSGNLGLGVTPSAWGTSGAVFKAMEYGVVGNAIAGISNGSSMDTMSNAYYNSGWKYANSSRPALRASLNGDVSGAFTWNQAASGTAGAGITWTQAMTLDASGNLLVGTTSGVTNGGFSFEPNYNGGGVSSAFFGHSSSGGNGNQYCVFAYNGTFIGSITQSGTTAVLYNTSSDARLKTNIVDAPSGNINSIKVRSFDWIADGSHQEYGMVAQELIEVAPYAVSKPENPDEMMGVDYSKLVPMMIKEIQDLKAEVNQLKTKIGV